MKHTRAAWLVIAMLVGTFFAAIPEAHARRRGFVLITSGESFSRVAEIGDEHAQEVRDATGALDVGIAYRYESFGLFYLDLWTWDGQMVLYSESQETYWDELSDEDVEELTGRSIDDVGKSLTYTFPPGLMVLLLAGLAYGAYTWWIRRAERAG